MSIIAWIIVGGIAGWLASLVMKTDARQGCLMNIIVGVIGAFIGGWLMSQLGIDREVNGLNFGSILVAFIGAVVFLGILRLFQRGR